ncbi:Glycosyltransferase involved in cell wall bisynthesis [Maridesulfovibrio ferrireducens]|uniref:Glycosyltransferase involved in cell wall bisynthesis n=1 Tax=Maridesulfovibrio ferrireducens TaxID=246191 RepID=A0A1G9CN24_9BACT|nr:glycosyltransferase family 4 protein [Maridesulfovibrio ferrireducens]SDK52835.1 Glycosyltransferase involved in cell wall bisynthesis [Maridesulfovibrio ferrireducens]
MRIAHIGNLANIGFLHCCFLRKAGVDAHLYVNENVKICPLPYSSLNFSIDEDWIHRYPRKNILSMIVNQVPLALELSKYDLVHSWTCSLLPAAEEMLKLRNKNYIASATGSDLREAATTRTFNGVRVRRHFKKASYVYHVFDPLTNSVVEKLDIKECGLLKIPVGATTAKEYDINPDRKTVFFLPSRLHYTSSSKSEAVFKNNNRFLNAYARYIHSGGNARLIMLKRGADYRKAVRVIEDLGIIENVSWLDEMSPKALAAFFYKCDVVVDQFNDLPYPAPGGGIAIEAMAHGTPVMIGSNAELSNKFYGSVAPNLSCSTEDEIYERILECEDKKYLRNVGQACKEWINKHHGWELVTSDLIKKYKEYL